MGVGTWVQEVCFEEEEGSVQMGVVRGGEKAGRRKRMDGRKQWIVLSEEDTWSISQWLAESQRSRDRPESTR